jgi:hypothetical protein
MTDDLDALLTLWAAPQRLTPAQVRELRERVLTSAKGDASLDSERLWSFLRPVTDLVDQLGGSRALRHMRLADDDAAPLTPYLRLA